ncbi:hypothetical protein [Devosia sp. MC521]|uniref:hypothetical protein n=1 Tax=Devosia sp. MC521 TaxID=2759954 RepID=UPI0015FD3AB8|nr:hypothetical protein [Devosia sp. MC521]MBJ6986921.1 hypothetical protein [Devosia sp. MC521]QMW63946.1 hypothetical protein H4N61_06415 [Devosia sp. MC521]
MSAFAKETDLCAAFIASLPEGWVAYPETGGFDILLVRTADGMQIGVEAKLKLNAKVISQVAEGLHSFTASFPQPDCRAVLVPDGVGMDLKNVCDLLGITVITVYAHRLSDKFRPALPRLSDRLWGHDDWFERCPAARLTLPDWVPDVRAGDSAPVALTPWKIGAIKLAITLEMRGYLTRRDFTHFKLSMARWSQEKWLIKDGKGGWIAGPNLPDFKAQHPVNFDQIGADYEKWKSPEEAAQPGLFVGGAA